MRQNDKLETNLNVHKIMSFIRSISGVRATLGDNLTPIIVAEYASAFSAVLSEGKIAVGNDGRPSGVWIEQIVCGALSACGREVVRLGIVPTPTVQLFAEMQEFAGGIAITASHNPSAWNGLKFLNGNGIFLDAYENSELWNVVDSKKFRFITSQQGGKISEESNSIGTHIAKIRDLPVFSDNHGENISLIRDKKFRVVVDAVNCSGSSAIPELLTEFGCEVIPLYCDGTGIFPHIPEPLPEYLGDLCTAVRENNADFGVAVDPDADRLVLIDERGETIWEEYTIVLSVLTALRTKSKFSTNEKVIVVVNLSTTGAVEDVAQQFGAEVLRTAVGEINVVKAMLERGALIGGEGSGGVILPACHAGRDSLVGTALILLLLAQNGLKLSEIIAELPRKSMVKLKKEFHGSAMKFFDLLQNEVKYFSVSRLDGLKFVFENGAWVHLRTSNTEPIIRVIAEAETKEEAEKLANEFMQRI